MSQRKQEYLDDAIVKLKSNRNVRSQAILTKTQPNFKVNPNNKNTETLYSYNYHDQYLDHKIVDPKSSR